MMRAPVAAVLALALVAGCVGGGDPPQETTPTPSPSPTPSTVPSATTTPGPATPPATPSPAPADPPPPRALLNVTFDFNRDGDPTGRTPVDRVSQPMPPLYTRVLVNASLERASVAPTTLPVSGSLNQPTIRIFAPNGTEVGSINTEGTKIEHSLPAQEGTWTARFEGAGTMRGIVVITAVA